MLRPLLVVLLIMLVTDQAVMQLQVVLVIMLETDQAVMQLQMVHVVVLEAGQAVVELLLVLRMEVVVIRILAIVVARRTLLRRLVSL